jgi:2-polyprenyl-3-methyl-5-hydroxy-6-metoxy-1,4-benzoquinol methylase
VTQWSRDDVEDVRACPFCLSQHRTTLYEGLEDRLFGVRGRWRLRRCADCGGAYLDPRPREDLLGRLYETYYTHEGPARPPVGGSRIRRVRRALRNGYLNAALGYSLTPAPTLSRLGVAPFPARRRKARLLVRDLPYREGRGRLLDVGCGDGSFLVTMSWAGWHAEGLDPDARAVAAARDRGLVVHHGTLDDVELPVASFDAITLSHVFEHLAQPLEALERCRALLRPDGLLWIATPNLGSPGHRRYGRDWIGIDAPRHFAIPTIASLRHAFASARFDVQFLQSNFAAWFLRASDELHLERGDRRPTIGRHALVELEARVQDLRARFDRGAGEELVVLARPGG